MGMQGKIQQVPILLVGLALVYIMGYSSAKNNVVGVDDEIADMKDPVERDEAPQPAIKLPIFPISRIGSVGGSGSSSKCPHGHGNKCFGERCESQVECCCACCYGSPYKTCHSNCGNLENCPCPKT